MSVEWKAAVLLFCGAPVAMAQETTETPSLQRRDLDNGLEVLVVENHAAPLATILVAVRSGAAVQRTTERGLAHLYEHVLFRSYGNGPSAFGSDAGRLNASYNGTTSHEVVTYYVLLPSENAEAGIRLLGRLATDPRFRVSDLAEERAVVLDELERGQADPEQALVREVSRQLWGAAWHRRDVGGDSLSLMGITAVRLTEEYQRYYVPNNAALIVTGDVIAADVFAAAAEHFAEWQARDDPFAGQQFVPYAPLAGSRAVIVARDLTDVTIHLKMSGPGLRTDPEATYAADALFDILNDPSSHFQEELVRGGLFQSVGASYLTLSEQGPITISGKTTVARAHDALEALLAQIDSLALLVGVDEEDLLIAARRREVDASIAREAAATLAPTLAFWWATGGTDYYRTYPDHMNALTLDDLRRFAEQYLVGKPKVMGLLGPDEAMARIAQWLGTGVRSVP
ncbi:MAG TPA: pitrilysin family protein [Gemmatimonadales bacterium]